jgi:hypothetical protein
MFMMMCTEFLELSTLEGLGEEIGHHVTSGTIFNTEFTILDPVGNKEVSDVDVTGAAAAGSASITFQQDGTLVVLENNVVACIVSLSKEEIACPDDLVHPIVDTNQFSFGGAASVQLLTEGGRDGAALSKGHGHASVALHVTVNSKRGINPPSNTFGWVSLQGQRAGQRFHEDSGGIVPSFFQSSSSGHSLECTKMPQQSGCQVVRGTQGRGAWQ